MPPVYEGVLDEEELEALFRDIVACADVVNVRIRESGRARVCTSFDAAGALALLRGGDAPALQLRYVYDGKLWCDSLKREASGVRLVRIEAPAAPRL